MESKTDKWTKESMQQAIDAYKKNIFGFNECCRKFGIPKPTFRRHLNNMVKRPLSSVKKTGALQTLPDAVEEELVQHLLNLEAVFIGFNITDVRRLAFEIAERNCIPHKFNRAMKMAGKKWFYSFMKRHPALSVRLRENISTTRDTGSNRGTADHFLDILKEIIRINELDATRIFNVKDESGFSTTGQKEKERIEQVVSGENRTNTTVVCCASASGIFVPPMLIFEGKDIVPPLACGAPAGSIIEIADHGFITSELFVKWLQHFIDFIKPTANKKVLLLLEGHTIHSKNLDALELACANGIILVQLPRHTTHALQSLDTGVFDPMSTCYNRALDQGMLNNVGQRVMQFDVIPIIATAYYQAASVASAVNVFKNTGCWPVNRFIFNNADFPASDLLNKENENENENNENDSDGNKNDENEYSKYELEVPEINILDLKEESNEAVVYSSSRVLSTIISPVPIHLKNEEESSSRNYSAYK